MALNPEQSLYLETFTDFNPLVKQYIDEFLYLVIFIPTDPKVSDFTPTAAELAFLKELWEEKRPAQVAQLQKIIRYQFVIRFGSTNTAEEAILLLREGRNTTTNRIFAIFKEQIPLMLSNLLP